MSDSKIIKKHFRFDQYEKEAEFLTDMHKQGWKLVNVKFGFINSSYYFEQCKEENVSYQLDYILDEEGNPLTDEELEERLLLYADAGWEKVVGGQDSREWYYFRKSGANQDCELYTDYESKLQLAQKVWGKVSFLLLIGILFIIPIFIPLLDIIKRENINSFSGGASTFVFILNIAGFLVLIYMMVRVLVFRYRIQNDIKNNLTIDSTNQNNNIKPVVIIVLPIIVLINVFAFLNPNVMQFCIAAAPWIVMGCVIAIISAMQGKR